MWGGEAKGNSGCRWVRKGRGAMSSSEQEGVLLSTSLASYLDGKLRPVDLNGCKYLHGVVG